MKNRVRAPVAKKKMPAAAVPAAGVPHLLAEAQVGLDSTLSALRSALELSAQGGRAPLEDLARQCEALVHGLNIEKRRRTAP